MFQRTLWQPAWWAGKSTVEIWTAARLESLLISLNAIESKKISLTDMQNFKTVCEGIKKSPASQDTLTSRLLNGNKHSSNLESATINSFLSMWRQLRWRKSHLLISKVLKPFLNALTGRDSYSLCNRDNLQQPFQMPLSHKQEIFSEFSFAFLKSTLNFEHFPKKEQHHTWFISEITDAEKGL